MRGIATRIISLLAACLLFTIQYNYAQVAITPGGSASQNFNGIGSSATAALPAGWKVDKQGVRTVGNYATALTATDRTGGNSLSTSAANGNYNFGANNDANERAIGALSSGSATQSGNLYVDLLNGGSSIPSFTISYNVEKYRGGSNAAGFSIQLYYSLNGSTWTSAGANFLTSFTPDATNDGYVTAPGATVAVSNKTLPVSVPAGSHLYLAWNYSVTSGTTTSNAQALAVDDIVITAASSANADLASLAMSPAGYAPAFNAATTSYSASVANSVNSVTINAVASDAAATVRINGNVVTGSTPVNLAVGSNTITIQVTAQDGTSTKTYTLTVTRAAAATPLLSTGSLPAAFGNVCVNTSAGPNSFTLNGSDLDGSNITVAALPGFAFSENAGGPFTNTLSVAYSGTAFSNKTIYVQFTPAATQSYDGSVSVSGGGATPISVSVSGTGINTPATAVTGSNTVTGGNAALQGSITATGCTPVSSYGFVYSTTSGFTPNTGTVVSATNLSGSNFSATLSGLGANTTFYYRAYATNAGGTVYGDQQSFSTKAIPVAMASQSLLTYSEDFTDISSWGNGFSSGNGAIHFSAVPVNTSGTIPDGVRVTTSNVFSSGTSGGIQKGAGNIVLLSTGSPDNNSSTAFDVFFDFSGVNAGTLSFDWASINNSTGDRSGSVRVYGSVDGISFTELPAAAVLNVINNSPTSGSVTNVALPASFHNNPNARLRFYYYNGNGGTTGSRPKISIDNLVVTALSTTPCSTPSAPATNLVFGTVTENSIQASFTASSPAANEYIVVMSTSSSLTSNPVDGQVYAIGDNIGDGSVVAKGAATSFTATGLDDATTYYFFVFPVNSVCTGGPMYRATDALTASATTPAGLPDCAAPATQATSLDLSGAGVTSISGSFTAAAGADEYLVVRTTGAALSVNPVNGQVYNSNDAIGNGVVVYRGNGVTFAATGLNPATAYNFYVFTVGSQACVNGPAYNITAPLAGTQSTQPLPVCSTPSAQPTNLAFTASNNTVAGTFNAAASGDAYLVIQSTNSTLSAAPADNTDYAPGTSFGGGTVITTTTATSFSAGNLAASTTYYYFVFAANKTCTGGTKYLAAQPLTASVTTTNAPANNIYFGNLHSHSDYSDGNQDHPGYTPTNDYTYALGSQGMDFLGISEHNHYSTENNPGTYIAKYHSGVQEAKNFTTAHPGFLALYGMEWGVISGGGHVVVYGDNMDKLFGWESNVGGTTGANYDVYVPKNVYTGPTGLFKTINDFAANNTFATLAHPNNTDYNNLSNVAYDTVADDAIVGSAVANGPSTSTNTSYSNPASSMSYLWYFQKLLSKGYHLGPIIDHDNHNTTFGRTTTARTAVIAPSLTQSDIIKGVRDMHFYATEDIDARVDFTVNTRIMGSVFTDRNAPGISVTLTDPTNSTANAIIRVMYGVPGSNVVAVKIDSVIGNTLNFVHNDLPTNSTGYYYIDITNNGKRIITSPVWYTRVCAISTDTTVAACNSYEWNGTTYTSSGTITQSFTTAGGCDSTVTLHLTINHPVTGDTTAVACGSFNWYGNTYTSSTTATHTFTAANGCDSVVTLHLTINPVPAAPTVTASGSTNVCPGTGVVLNTSAAAGVNYQWLKDGVLINGANSSNYTATASGSYSVTISNADNCTAGSNSVTVTVADNIAPVPNVTQLPVITAACSATVTAPTATDNCAGTITATTTDPLTYTAQGTYTIHWIYNDGNGNTASQTQTVIISDTEAPSISVQPVSANTAAGLCGAYVNLGTPVISDNCSADSLFNDAPANHFFHTGTTVVTWTVKDSHGNSNTAIQVVTVTDTEAPSITVQPVTANNAPGLCGAYVNLGTPVTGDNCAVDSIFSDAPANGFFHTGTTVVTWRVKDIHGNYNSALQIVTVKDTEAPTIVTQPVTVNNAPGLCGAYVTIAAPVTSDNCGVDSIFNDIPANGFFHTGTTVVTWTVKDIYGNYNTALQVITVKDMEKPVVAVPAPVTMPASAGNCGATITLVAPAASDNCGIASVTNDAPATFQVGTTNVQWTVTDTYGNTTTVMQQVTVTDNQLPVLTVPADINTCNDNQGNQKTVVLTASDNCGIQGISYTITGATTRSGNNGNASGAFGVGVSTIKWTVKDVNGNTTTATTTVTIGSAPTIAVAATIDPFCNGVTVTASAAPAGTYSYQWYYNNQPFATGASITLTNSNANGVYSVKATNAGGCNTAVAGNYTYDKTTVSANYTLFAAKGIKLGQNNQVQSGSVGVSGSNGEVEVKKNSGVTGSGAFVKARTIDIQNPVNIANRIYSPAQIVVPAMQVYTGNYNNLPDYTSAQYANIMLTGNYDKLTIRKGTTAVLKGTTFRDIVIEEGSNVTFTSTVINMESLQVGTGANYGTTTVRFADNTSVRAGKQVKIEEDCNINPEGRRLVFYVGDYKCDEEKFKVTGSNTRITANVVLPNGKIKVEGNGNATVWMTGHFISEEIESGSNVTWNTGSCGGGSASVANAVTNMATAADAGKPEGSALELSLRPNPAVGRFIIHVASDKTTPVTVRILDAQGRVLEARSQVSPGSNVTMGATLPAGNYLVEGIQDGTRKMIKGIKLH